MAVEETSRVMNGKESEKISALVSFIRDLQKIVVAFSGGVDSSLLLAASVKAFGEDAVAVTVRSPFSLARDVEDASSVAASLGARAEVIDMNELDNADVRANGPRRCYFCKKLRYARLIEYADANDIPWILDGTNADDIGDYRPGLEAVRENVRIRSPLLELGFDKAAIRAMSRELGLATWNKPAMACLATRVATDEEIAPEKLAMVARSESAIMEILGPDARNAQLRVRSHGNLARIEADRSIVSDIMSNADGIVCALEACGFRYISLDLGGYKMGNMNIAK